MNEKFLIKSWGRCGSTFVQYWLSNNNNCEIETLDKNSLSNKIKKIIKQKNNCAIASHNFWLPKNSKKWHYIHVKRRQKFEQIISLFVVNITNRYTKYNDQIFNPVVINIEKFKNQIKSLKLDDDKFEIEKNQHDWKYCYTLYYEDFIDNSEYLNFLKIYNESKSFYTKPLLSQKNPRDNCKLIVNYEELRECFNQNYSYLNE